MNNIKIMLLSLTLFAAIGGALAFKAKFDHDYCTTAFPGSNLTCGDVTCPDFISQRTTLAGNSEFLCTTTAPNIDCTKNQTGDNVQCAAAPSTRLRIDQ